MYPRFGMNYLSHYMAEARLAAGAPRRMAMLTAGIGVIAGRLLATDPAAGGAPQ
jgi:hypothetical protein